MNKHTAGPWIAEKAYYGQGARANVIRGNNRNIAHMNIIMWAPEIDPDVQEMIANARLIASAPELLEACRDILPFLDDLMGVRCLQTAARWGGTTFDTREDIRAAINAAERGSDET
ncbi:MAG: hypothetical protein ABIA77_02355 [Candidatus Omnitrophota bacterium]